MSEQRNEIAVHLTENERTIDAAIKELKRDMERLTLEANVRRENARVAALPAERLAKTVIAVPLPPVEPPILDFSAELGASVEGQGPIRLR